MEVLHPCCCGLDVHKQSIAACVLWAERAGKKRREKRSFGTFTEDLLALADWLQMCGVTHVAMESTGVYWKPVWNILEGRFTVLLVNAPHIKAVPGRKSDQQDCEWIADLLQHGLLHGSFVPPRPIRELRDLTRHRTSLAQEYNRIANRIQKLLEDANIKLACVATDVLGTSGRAMLEAIAAGQNDALQLAEMSRGKLRKKLPAMQRALEGHITAHHRFLLGELLEHLRFVESKMIRVEQEIEQRLKPWQAAVDRLRSIPGVERLTASTLLAEIGVDMRQFPTAQHLASWAGLCPGSHESAGKRKTGRTRKGSVWLRRCLCQSAWAASSQRNTYLSARFHRLAARRGGKRAILAVAHSILVIAFHLLDRGLEYRELGGDFFDRLHPDTLRRRLVRRLETLGHKVTLEPLAHSA